MMAAESRDRLRVGMIAPEFLGFGGMAEFARHLAACLAGTDDVTVFTRTGVPARGAPAPPPVPVLPVLARELGADLEVLSAYDCDVWFAANAGYASLASDLEAPLVVYVNGNDLLSPWVRRSRPWVDRIETSTLVWRLVSRLRQRLRERDLRRGLADAARIVANSANTAAILADRFPGNEARTSVVHPGVADHYFRPRPPRRPGPLRILTVTRLDTGTPRKNVDGVLRALALLDGEVPIEYTIVGDGEDRPRVERLAAELGIAAGTRFAGFVDSEELARTYGDSDVFILASRASASDVEGFGIVYMEASAAGTPVVCSRAGGAVDAVAEGRNGVILADSEPDTIAAALREFAKRPERWDADRVRAVAEPFRWPVIAGKIRAVLVACAATGAE